MKPTPTPTTSRYPLWAILSLLWIVLILGLYYWVHKPLTPALVAAVGGAALDIAVALIMTALGAGLARRVLSRLDFATWTPAERVALHGLVGLSLLSLLVLAVGVVALHALSMIALLLALAVIGGRDALAWTRDLRDLRPRAIPARPWERLLIAVTGLMVALALLLAVLPPTMWDVLTYHLAGPQQYVEHGRIYAAPHNHFLGFPQLADTLYAGQLALTGRLAGSAVLHWVTGALMLLMVGGYAARRAGPAAGWLAAATLLAGFTIWLEFTFAYADLMPVALAAAALAVVERWRGVREKPHALDANSVRAPSRVTDPGTVGAGFQTRPGQVSKPAPTDTNTPPALTGVRLRAGLGYLLLVGVLIGFGMSTKYSVLWLGVAFGVLVLWSARREGLRAVVVFGVVYGLAAAITLLPWLVRNAAFYDNPVYPLVLEAGEMDALRQDWYGRPGSGMLYREDAWQVPIIPLAATVFGVEGKGTYGTDIGPLLLILLSLLPLAWGRLTGEERQTAARALVVVGVITAVWVFSAAFSSYISVQTRLVMYMFGPLAVVCGITFEALRRLPKKPFDLSFVVQGLIALVLVFMVINALVFTNNSALDRYFSGKDGYHDDYLTETLTWHYVSMQTINELPPGTTVRFLWEPRYLYCDNVRLNCRTDSLMDSWYYARRTVADGDPAQIAAAWQDAGADYLLVYDFGRRFERDSVTRYDAADWDAWDVFISDHLVEQWRNGKNPDDEPQYILYAWRDSG